MKYNLETMRALIHFSHCFILTDNEDPVVICRAVTRFTSGSSVALEDLVEAFSDNVGAEILLFLRQRRLVTQLDQQRCLSP